jgi:hypothetical protein
VRSGANKTSQFVVAAAPPVVHPHGQILSRAIGAAKALLNTIAPPASQPASFIHDRPVAKLGRTFSCHCGIKHLLRYSAQFCSFHANSGHVARHKADLKDDALISIQIGGNSFPQNMAMRKMRIAISAVLLVALGAYSGYLLRSVGTSGAPRSRRISRDQNAEFLDCVPISDAQARVNEPGCVTGQVLKVYTSRANHTFFDFCSDYRSCPFSAVVFAEDRPQFSDLVQFSGREVEIRGKITLYQNRAQIIIRDPSQIRMKP